MMNIVSVKDILIGKGIPKVIIPLMGVNLHELKSELNEVKKENPDIIEWRVDALKEAESIEAVIYVLSELHKEMDGIPLLFTFRSYKEGGMKNLNTSVYINLLSTAIESGYLDLIDLELFTGTIEIKRLVEKAKRNQVIVIMSNHDFEGTPTNEEMTNRLISMENAGADIVKIAVMPNSISDVLRLLTVAETIKTTAKQPYITIAMGKKGILSRIAGEFVGSAATFGSGKHASALGQIAAEELKYLMERLHYHSNC
ncbi:type I 3-dehydroquinate dehydratase [Virgibacillus salarius]|uniref:type I 3-dehydroquinate dehydratase n=1 Tax=Virgibacillus salarius TaxID=447199 RepID=UPI0024929802|nr:type I 3-dehydroquinate dehydratase [Virgibacillus salarius]WBX78694.1 type I 3-dehydroquinate dehydratase [Virgibacillus salarius]